MGAAAASTVATGGLLGVVALAPLLSKKSKSLAFIVFPSGVVHQRKLDGNMAIRGAQAEVVRFNALVAADASRPQTGTSSKSQDSRFTADDHERALRAGREAMRKMNGGR